MSQRVWEFFLLLDPLKLRDRVFYIPVLVNAGNRAVSISLTHEERIKHLEMVKLAALKNLRTLSALECENI